MPINWILGYKPQQLVREWERGVADKNKERRKKNKETKEWLQCNNKEIREKVLGGALVC